MTQAKCNHIYADKRKAEGVLRQRSRRPWDHGSRDGRGSSHKPGRRWGSREPAEAGTDSSRRLQRMRCPPTPLKSAPALRNCGEIHFCP